MEFRDEGWAADALHGVGGDDEPQFLGELRLLDEAEGFRCVGDARNMTKLPFQD